MNIRFRKTIDNSAERLICIGLISSDYILAQLQPILNKKIWTVQYTHRVASWCLEYFERHQSAPKLHIKDIFENAKREYLEEDESELIEMLLHSINEQAVNGDENFNEEYILHEAEKYIKSRSIQMTCEDALAHISRNQLVEAEGVIARYSIPKRPTAEGDDVFSDSFWGEQEEEKEVLFNLKGALGDLIGPVERDSLISILAPEKKGKTWYLLEFALTALRSRCNVVFFSIGDMTKPQMRRRIRHMLTGRDPKRAKDSYVVPVLDCAHNQDDSCPLGKDTDPITIPLGKTVTIGTYEDLPDHKVCTDCVRGKKKSVFNGAIWYKKQDLQDLELSLNDARATMSKQSGNRRMRLFCHPPATATVTTLVSQLDILEQQEGFIPDVIVIDYADLLAPDIGAAKLDYRNQINHSWMGLRALAQIRNCAIITATQAKIDAHKNDNVNQWDVSEDKRKLAHVTAMLALNQTPADKRKGIMRISNLAMRDSDFDVDQNVVVLQCLGIGKPYIASYMQKLSAPKKPKGKEDE